MQKYSKNSIESKNKYWGTYNWLNFPDLNEKIWLINYIWFVNGRGYYIW